MLFLPASRKETNFYTQTSFEDVVDVEMVTTFDFARRLSNHTMFWLAPSSSVVSAVSLYRGQ